MGPEVYLDRFDHDPANGPNDPNPEAMLPAAKKTTTTLEPRERLRLHYAAIEKVFPSEKTEESSQSPFIGNTLDT